jgi:hypothetical protein
MRPAVSFWLLLAVTATAQMQRAAVHRSASKTETVSIPAAAPQPVSLLDQPAQPAQVQFDGQKLSIKADNSTLSAILQEISSRTGMKVDGPVTEQRIFGSYGPASPREVVASLLDGLAYNVVMVGRLGNGAPRELILTPRSGGIPTNSPVMVARQMQENDAENGDNGDENMPPDEPPDTSPLPPRPVNTPEMNGASPAPSPSDQNGGVKTPQQLLQELQDLRARQQQQQQNPQ